MTQIALNGFPRFETPTHCAGCNAPLKTIDGQTHAWHGSDGKLYCDDLCASDADEAAFCAQTRRTKGRT